MEYIRGIAQLIIALGILNVWLLRFNKATSYRGGAAKNMKEEFATYGLPVWFMWFAGGLKVLLALCLLASFWKPELMRPAAIGMAILMAGAVAMHIKTGDALKKTTPALSVLILSLLVAFS
jgi:DoxX-like family